MKPYHEIFHFRDEECNVVGAYLYNTQSEIGFPLRMREFQKFVVESKVAFLETENGEIVQKLTDEEKKAVPKTVSKICHGMTMGDFWDNDFYAGDNTFELFANGKLPAVINPIVKLPFIGEIIQISIYGPESNFFNIKSKMPRLCSTCAEVNILESHVLTMQVPYKVWYAYKEELIQGLEDCIFCWPPMVGGVTNTENVRESSAVHRFLRTRVIEGLPLDIVEFFGELNNQKIKETNGGTGTSNMSLF